VYTGKKEKKKKEKEKKKLNATGVKHRFISK
jgi:hypothetical protein